jgi:hypothetical protein
MKRFFIFIGIILVIIIGGTVVYAALKPTTNKPLSTQPAQSTNATPSTPEVVEPEKPLATHIKTPKPLKALYISSWVASSPKPLAHVMDIIESTEINAVVIDIKDSTGKVSFLVDDPIITATKSPENRIKNIREFINQLHEKNIYVIGRVSTFQDDFVAKSKPEWALKKKSDGSVWKDRKGLPFLDPANPDVVNYLVAIGRASYNVGFDEINYDYIRYPSDGNIKDIDYKLAPGKTRADNITAFAEKLHDELKKDAGIIISADVFGLTTTETTDMGIGQVFERMLPYFDYIAPMIYPSHYANGEYGIKVPAEKPYETIMKALAGAKKKTRELATTRSSETSETGTVQTSTVDEAKAAELYAKVRPWLQDFSIGKTKYDVTKVVAQIKATNDSGLDSWMMWDPSNRYTTGAYQKN